jgi:hypothetical protein
MKYCGSASDTLNSLLMMRPADRAWMGSGFNAGGREGLAEEAPEVNRAVAEAIAVSWRSLA